MITQTGKHFFGSRIGSNDQFQFRKDTSNRLDFYNQNSGTISVRMITNAVFRDTAWYHIVLKVDVTTGTSANAIYVNGVEQSLSTDTSSNANTYINSQNPQQIGRWDTGNYINSYLAEMHFIDGTALDATSFGEEVNSIWRPVAYSGSYGTNGFYLDFSTTSYTDNGSDPDVFADQAGSNDFNAYAVSAHDIVPDSPTNNWCVLNYNDSRTSQGFKQGGLKLAGIVSYLHRPFNYGHT